MNTIRLRNLTNLTKSAIKHATEIYDAYGVDPRTKTITRTKSDKLRKLLIDLNEIESALELEGQDTNTITHSKSELESKIFSALINFSDSEKVVIGEVYPLINKRAGNWKTTNSVKYVGKVDWGGQMVDKISYYYNPSPSRAGTEGSALFPSKSHLAKSGFNDYPSNLTVKDLIESTKSMLEKTIKERSI